MQVLVTGGAGYIGSVIVEELVGAGHTPVVFDTLVTGHVSAVLPDIPLVQGDIRDVERVRQALLEYGIEAVIHLAALTEVEQSVRHPEAYFDVNVGGSISVLRAMIDVGVRRLVFSSTAAVYGDPERLPVTEDEPTRPTNPYGESKMLFERMLRWVAAANGLACTSLRTFNAAGATELNGEQHTPETHLIPLVLRAAIDGTPIKVCGTDYSTTDGTGVRDYLHVVDLARAHLLALHRDEPGLRIYNLGTGSGYSVRQVIEAARAVTGKELPTIELPRRSGDQIATVASAGRVRQELGWEPRYRDINDMVGSAWRWLQGHQGGYAQARGTSTEAAPSEHPESGH
jgi:UDP-glucose 4-epimerase